MTIWIVRHGETALNAARVVQPPDTPLSPRGQVQASRVAERLAEFGIAQVWASNMPRAAQTAEAIREHIDAPLHVEPLLRERNFGALCGTPYPQLPPDAFGPEYVPDGGESWPVFLQRAAEAWRRMQQVATACPGDLVVVTHGLVCHAWANHHLQLPAGTLAPAKFHNTSVTRCEKSPPHQVRLLNCVAHLETADRCPPGAVA